MSEKMEYIHHTILQAINAFVDATLTFYELDNKLQNRDLRRELFVNLISNFILEDQLYFLIFNLTSNCLERQMLNISKIMASKAIQENKINIDQLHIKKQFHFDVNFRNKYRKVS